mmetsp:Transcript_17603/g.29960  ORF Transcript_17603/g.29960 Transcript_17603/m.29960 type:complete len:283 (-) Transcript_17603:2-850(-)
MNTTPEDPTLGSCLRAAFANSPSIPDAIVQQFDNNFQLPASLVTPREHSDSQHPTIPHEYITTIPRTSKNLKPDPSPPSTKDEFSSPKVRVQSNTNAFESHLPTLQIPKQVTSHSPSRPYTSPSRDNQYPMDNNYPLGNSDTNIPFEFQNPELDLDARLNGNNSLSVTHSPDHMPPNPNVSLIPAPSSSDQKYSDITEFLNLPQSVAAKKLGIPPSTLSKRWREAAPNRKWPYRTVCKIDKEITTLLHNIPQDGVIPKDIESKLSALIAKRQEELKSIVIRM